MKAKGELMAGCAGLYFRGKVNNYMSNGKYVYQESMSLLKRISCNGCDECGWILDDIKESTGNGKPPIINAIKDGEVYRVIVTNESNDWETGIIDDYDLEFVETTTVKGGYK
jgi:hypothetical protein